jgi:hypothetical protein
MEGSAKQLPGMLKWVCLGCWERLYRKLGEAPPSPYWKGPCEECGAENVPRMHVRTDSR